MPSAHEGTSQAWAQGESCELLEPRSYGQPQSRHANPLLRLLTCVHGVHDVRQRPPDADAEQHHEAEEPRVLVRVEREAQVDEDDEGREDPSACSENGAGQAVSSDGMVASQPACAKGHEAIRAGPIHTRTELEDVWRRAVVGRVHGAEDAEDEEDHRLIDRGDQPPQQDADVEALAREAIVVEVRELEGVVCSGERVRCGTREWRKHRRTRIVQVRRPARAGMRATKRTLGDVLVKDRHQQNGDARVEDVVRLAGRFDIKLLAAPRRDDRVQHLQGRVVGLHRRTRHGC